MRASTAITLGGSVAYSTGSLHNRMITPIIEPKLIIEDHWLEAPESQQSLRLPNQFRERILNSPE